jgi:hypothetical protein
VATLEQLQERKRELEGKLYAGDTSVEAALDQVDNAIATRTRKVQHSQQRLAAVKQAVAKGMSVADAKAVKATTTAQKKAAAKARKPLNRF